MIAFRSRPGMPLRAIMTSIGLVLAMAGCSPRSSAPDEGNTANTGASESAPASDAPLPSDFTGTAWRSDGTDGARYTTYIDAQGRYRDWRDGQPWASGTWENSGNGAVCFTPDGDNVLRRCWQPDKMTADGTMTATAEDGHKIELTEVDYSPPTPSVSGTPSEKAHKTT